ncbi:LysM peptidoglycan-binding domain-containing protein [Bacillus sp. JJ1503]|uniref:LysM peptidoglycan-binding domain-containing protein n=1 Tax=Bacillus sp. JJ1503 TaxID=3122956 RepID=UPI002FFF9A9B
MIERWKRERKPIRFVMTGTINNFDVTIREFTVEPEKAGSPGDIYYTMSLKEYRHVTIKKVGENDGKAKATKGSERPAPPPNQPTTYVVKKDDSLWKIAARVYGDGTKFTKIFEANKAVIGKNQNLILPGQKLVIPK